MTLLHCQLYPEARLVAFRDGFFRHIRTKNNHPVKVPAVPPKTANVFCYGCWDTGWTDTGCPCPCGKPGVVP